MIFKNMQNAKRNPKLTKITQDANAIAPSPADHELDMDET
jgi:hypothetical protein